MNFCEKPSLPKLVLLLAVLIGLIIALMSVGCSIYKFVGQLDPATKDWYRLHEVLMHTKVPDWIDESQPSERMHFLRLPKDLQKQYIKMFWKIREPGLREVFYGRVAYANRHFLDKGHGRGWNTDRGRIVVLCGMPTMARTYQHGRERIGEPWGEGWIQIWMYYHYRVGTAYYMFIYTPPDTWREEHHAYALHYISARSNLEHYWRKRFAPTENGWSAWGDYLYNALRTD